MTNPTLSPTDSSIPKKRAVIWKAVSSERQAHDDKVSLEEQERLAREWCEDNDYDVIRVLEVPGVSRRESDPVKLLDFHASQGIYAYHELKQMWEDKSFEVLVAYSHDRLGRSNTVHSWVIESVIINGMNVCLLADGGIIDYDDFRYKLAIGGMMAATPIDKLIKASAAAKDKLVQQGLPTGNTIPLSHKLIRDPKSGKAIELILDEDYTQLFADLAEIFLEGVAYNFLSKELFKRYGHVQRETGKPYRANQFYDLLFTPTFWGHMARRYTYPSKNGNQRGAWVFDETVDPPTGVNVARNVIPAVYTGERAEAIKAELYRRMETSGKRRSYDTYRFAGLFVCGACGANMVTRSKPNRGRTGIRCGRVHNRVSDAMCDQRRMTPHRYLQAEMENLLEQLVAGASPDIFNPHDEDNSHELQALKKLNTEKKKLQSQINNLIMELSLASDAAKELFRNQIDQLSTKLERTDAEILRIQRKLEEDEQMSHEEVRTIEELKKLTLECFWKLPDREINQWLRRLMGRRKFVIVDREIVDVAELPAKKRKSGRTSKKD